MYCYSLQNGVVFLQLQSLCGIFSVLRCNITRSSRHTASLVFCAFQNHLYSVTFCFLCHNSVFSYFLAYNFDAFPITQTFSYSIFQSSIQSFLINNAQTISANAKANPTILFYIIELLAKQVYIKGSFSSSL